MHKNSKKKKKNGTPVSSVLKTLNGCQSFSHSICFSCWKTDIKPLEAVISNSLFFLFPCASSRVLVALDVTAQLDQVLALHGSEPTGSDIVTCIDSKKKSEGKEISVFFFFMFTSVPYVLVHVHVDLIKETKICHIHFKSNVNRRLSLIKRKKTFELACRANLTTKMNIAVTSPSPPPIQCWFLFMQQCDNIPNFWGEGGKIE